MTYNEILSDPEYHFENSYMINFDLIHNECRGDKLSFSKKYYQTISNDCLKKKYSRRKNEAEIRLFCYKIPKRQYIY